eukprot:6184330-Pleurochrysis_carterae.AAC.1
MPASTERHAGVSSLSRPRSIACTAHTQPRRRRGTADAERARHKISAALPFAAACLADGKKVESLVKPLAQSSRGNGECVPVLTNG